MANIFIKNISPKNRVRGYSAIGSINFLKLQFLDFSFKKFILTLKGEIGVVLFLFAYKDLSIAGEKT
tara:strand:+ start:1257 stop:1457 length:201 start_codon:yes stop_codon:yes gene_type:complete